LFKKTYLTILSVAIVSVLLGSLFLSNVTFAPKPTQPTRVEVTNFPLDEQGNLLTTTVETSQIVLVFNNSLSVPSDIQTYHYLTSFNTSEFKYGYIMAKAQGTWQDNANVHILPYRNSFGIQTAISYMSVKTWDSATPDYGAGHLGPLGFYSTSVDLYLQVYNSDVGFSGLLTIAVHLSN
jgi:hypothetical protein